MIALALLTGVILGFRFRIGLVLAATAAVLLLALGFQLRDAGDTVTAFAAAALCATLTQGVALLVHILKDGFDGGAGVRA